ncbi:MAG: hypothetical protein U1E23_13395 [Reyranellaceae bacterium]
MTVRRALLLGMVALAGCAEPRPQAPASSPLGVDLGPSTRVAGVPGQVGEGEFRDEPPAAAAPTTAAPKATVPPAPPPVDHSKMHHDHSSMSHD